MTKMEAITLYFKNRPASEQIIKKLTVWDEEKTLRENALLLGMSIQSASQFKICWKLSCRKVRGWLKGPRPASFKVQAFIDLKKVGWNIPEIAGLFRVSRQAVHQSIKAKGDIQK